MKEKKDVLFLCQYFYPEYVSSATLPYDTAKALVKAGFSVSALCGYPSEYNKEGEVPMEEVHEGVKIKRLKYLQLKRSNFLGRLINYFSFTVSVASRILFFKGYKSIIVYSNPPILPFVPIIAKKLFRSKVVFVSYDVYPEMGYITKSISKNGFISKMMKKMNKSIFKNIDRLVVISYEMKNYLINNRDNLSEDRVSVIPNWYADKIIDNMMVERSLRNPLFSEIKLKSEIVISYFGNLGICQDISTILEAIRHYSNDSRVNFVFAGHGIKFEYLKKIVNEEDLKHVRIYDFLHGQDFQDALNISDVFLVSLAEGVTGLGVPSKTYSYMMAGKPIIAIMGDESDISIDLNDRIAGYSMKVGDKDKIIEAITELRDNPGKRKTMGQNCRKVFEEKYTEEICTNQYVDMIKNVLGENKNV